MRLVALALAAVLALPAFTAARAAEAPASAKARARAALAVEDVVLTAFREAARAGAAEARPARPRTVNARPNRWPALKEPPPAPGVGRKVTVQAYAYHLRGFTARGTRTQMGTVAVDPRVIPLGSKIYIPGYGWGRAVDTGGAIKGRKIDVWFPTRGQCMQWGIRDVTITVVP